MGNLNETIKLIRFIGVRTVGAKGGLATPPPMFLQNRHHLGIQHWGVGLALPPLLFQQARCSEVEEV